MRKPRWFSFVALLFVLSLVAAACAEDEPSVSDPGGDDPTAACDEDEFGCVEVAAGDAIQLGTLLVIVGSDAALGLDSQYGAQIAVDMYGDIEGHSVELVNEDEGCTPEGGTTGARSLVSNESIAAVIGTSCSSAGEPAAQITSDAGVTMISPSNTAPSLTDPATHQPFYLRTAHNDKIQGAAMAKFVGEELGLKTAATIHDGSPYAEQLQQVFADTFTSEYGGEITGQEAILVGDTDMKPALTSVAAAKPEFLYFPVFVAEGGALAAQGRETAGLEDTKFGGADGMLTPDWVEAAGAENAEGTYLSGPDLAFGGGFYEDEFLPAYKEAYGDPTAVFHAHAFDATTMVLNAIKEAAIVDGDSLFIPRTALRDAMFATSDYAGITGTLTCDENGDCNPGATISVSQVVDGAFERIWP